MADGWSYDMVATALDFLLFDTLRQIWFGLASLALIVFCGYLQLLDFLEESCCE